MSSSYVPDGLPVADLGGGKDLFHFAAERSELLHKAQLRHHLQDEARQFQAQVIDLLQFLDVDVGDDRADAMDGLNQTLGFEARQDAPNRRAADLEFLGKLFLGKMATRRIVEQADA